MWKESSTSETHSALLPLVNWLKHHQYSIAALRFLRGAASARARGPAQTGKGPHSTNVCVCAVPSKGAHAPALLHTHAGLPNAAVLKRGSSAFSLHTLPLRKGGQNQTVPHGDRLYRKLLLSPKAAPDSENGARQKTACMIHELHRSSQKATETTPWHKRTS